MSCPTPTKAAFRYRHSAETALRQSRSWDGPVACYQCRCGQWHLTTKGGRP